MSDSPFLSLVLFKDTAQDSCVFNASAAALSQQLILYHNTQAYLNNYSVEIKALIYSITNNQRAHRMGIYNVVAKQPSRKFF